MLQSKDPKIANNAIQSSEVVPSSVAPAVAPTVVPQTNSKDKKEKKERKSRKREISATMSCSICQECMVLPVTLVCGHNYCKGCIEQWIETNARPKCPLCKCVLGNSSVVLNKIGVNKVLDEIITQEMEDNEEYAKRLKKVMRTDNRKQFSRKYLESNRYSLLEERMMQILEESRGTIKYNNLLKALENPSDNSAKFEKAELDFFLHEESIKGTRLLLIDDFVVDWFYNSHLAEGGFLLTYLKTHLKELAYVLLNGGLEDDVLKEYESPQSDFFKKLKLDDENRIERKLCKIKQKI